LPSIEIHGRHSPDWMNALAPSSDVWRYLPRFQLGARKRIVIPLLEKHVASMPDDCWALVPDARSLSVFADKLAFAHYAAQRGLGALVPRTLDLAAPKFPAVLKRTNLNAGIGVVVVTSQAELDAHLGREPWAGQKLVLQELIEARTEYVTHVVCAGGRIVWHRSYAYAHDTARTIRGTLNSASTIQPVRLMATELAAFEKFTLPLGFDGPANIDFRRRADGSLAILEINPRLGGSLMRPENTRDLAGALNAIIRHAKWRAPAHSQSVVGVPT
jgi:glutathione synthase/RimK-type ligase-like ATP-grasp enzyme